MAAGQLGAKDVDGNVTCGDTLLADTSNSLVHATSRLVGVLGVQRLVIVETADTVLVTDSSRSHAVGKLVANFRVGAAPSISCIVRHSAHGAGTTTSMKAMVSKSSESS